MMWDTYIVSLLFRLIMAAYSRGEELVERIEGDFVVVDSQVAPLYPGEFVDGEVEAAEECEYIL